MNENQIILIDKPSGISSFGVVAKVRARLRNQFGHKVKVGHTGTLDPFATGLLILLSGQMTKKSNDFLKLDKIYDATLRLGFTSTTGDPEGEITPFSTTSDPEGDITPISPTIPNPEGNITPISPTIPNPEQITATLSSFIGKIPQTVPKFSAIKINGTRAYKLARENKDFETPTRTISIYSIDLIDYTYPTLRIRVHCSSGTYIRTLAADIGQSLKTGAYLTALRRLKIADYSVENAHPLTDYTD